jgi:hypothetical protein
MMSDQGANFVVDLSEPDRPTKPLPFTMEGDTFYAAPVAPANALRDLAKMAEYSKTNDVSAMMDGIDKFIGMVLLPESAELFNHRLGSPDKPITQAQLGRLVQHLVKEYSGRPTEPASSSATGQVNIGPSSTDTPSHPAQDPSNVWGSGTPLISPTTT